LIEDRSEKDFERKYNRYKLIFTIIETVSFVMFLVSSIIAILDFIFTTKYEFFELFKTPQFIIMVTSGLVFLFTPKFIKYIAIKGRELIKKIRMEDFKLNFVKNFRDIKEFDLNEISRKFKIELNDLKEIFGQLMADGVIKGDFEGDKFILDEGFQIQTIEEANINKFKESIVEYVKPYRWLNIPKTAKYFQIPESVALQEIQKLIKEKKIVGFLDGENLVRELSLISADMTDFPECPFCENKVLPHSKFCSTCGKQIDFDITPEGE